MGAERDARREPGFYWVEPWKQMPGRFVCAEWIVRGERRYWMVPGCAAGFGSAEFVTIDEHQVVERAAAERATWELALACQQEATKEARAEAERLQRRLDQIEKAAAEFGDQPALCLSIIGEICSGRREADEP